MKDGRYQRFYLVSRGTTVKPIRGVSVRIPVCEDFTLPAGKPFYQFPLFQGENADELGFSARLDSPSFPLKQDTECNLNLTFEYGADEPYKLIFTPFDKSFPAVRATWRRTEEVIVTDAPSPGYPEPMSWNDLRSVPKPGSDDTSDLLKWFLQTLDIMPHRRTTGEIKGDWREDKNGNHYGFAKCDEANGDVFIHEHAFVNGVDYDGFAVGDVVSFELLEEERGLRGLRVARPNCHVDDIADDIVMDIRKRAYVPFIQIWKDGRSISDRTCPGQFAKAARDRIAHLANLLKLNGIPQRVKNELLFLLSCLHKDTAAECVEWITEQVDKGNMLDPRAVGFALGDVSEGWQQSIFRKLASNLDNSVISVFAYAIWREQHVVEQFSIEQLEEILDTLSRCMSKSLDLGKRKGVSGKVFFDITRYLELMLGLLRTRASTNPDIKMLLQPHQNITKELAEQIDRVEDVIAESNINLFSRVQLNIQKPDRVRTPDLLLYALRLYLTGDDGANAIHITSISDGDND